MTIQTAIINQLYARYRETYRFSVVEQASANILQM